MVFLISQISHLEIKMIQFGIVNVEKGVTTEIKAILEEDASFFIEKSKSSQVVQNKVLPETVKAPIEKDSKIGEVTFSVNDEVLKTVNIVASESVKRLNLINMTTNLYNNWFKLMR